jgi:hypothetical protein
MSGVIRLVFVSCFLLPRVRFTFTLRFFLLPVVSFCDRDPTSSPLHLFTSSLPPSALTRHSSLLSVSYTHRLLQ